MCHPLLKLLYMPLEKAKCMPYHLEYIFVESLLRSLVKGNYLIIASEGSGVQFLSDHN